MKLNYLLPVLLFFTLITSCKNEEENLVTYTAAPLNTGNLPAQSFIINAERDTVIKGSGGTLLTIYKNTFVDKNGQLVNGDIEFELKEALTNANILLSGLTTTSDGKPLETGGMIYTNATANREPISIAADKYIGVAIPAATIRKDMQIFTGVQDSNGINWVVPYATLNDKLQKAGDMSEIHRETKREEQKGLSNSDIDAIVDYVNSDSASNYVSERDTTYATSTPIGSRFPGVKEQQFLNSIREKGSNYSAIDPNTAYIFSKQKLGWINIDAFFSDKRTKEIQLKTTIENIKDFNARNVYVSIVIQKLYLPGYQRQDNCYGFSHGDHEPTELPVGEQATIIATAKKGDKLYFNKQTFTIQNEQNIILKLEETTKEQLKAALQ